MVRYGWVNPCISITGNKFSRDLHGEAGTPKEGSLRMYEKPIINGGPVGNQAQQDAQSAWMSITRPCGVDFLVLLRGFQWTRERYIAEYSAAMDGDPSAR